LGARPSPGMTIGSGAGRASSKSRYTRADGEHPRRAPRRPRRLQFRRARPRAGWCARILDPCSHQYSRQHGHHQRLRMAGGDWHARHVVPRHALTPAPQTRVKVGTHPRMAPRPFHQRLGRRAPANWPGRPPVTARVTRSDCGSAAEIHSLARAPNVGSTPPSRRGRLVNCLGTPAIRFSAAGRGRPRWDQPRSALGSPVNMWGNAVRRYVTQNAPAFYINKIDSRQGKLQGHLRWKRPVSASGFGGGLHPKALFCATKMARAG
jgi:hypothetical protein